MADFSVKKISPKLGGERGTRNPNGPTSSHDLVEQMEFLYVEVIKAIKNSANKTCLPIVEITLGNYKSSTKDLPMGSDNEWNQVFAFDKSKGDVLSVTLKDGHLGKNILIAKKNFKLAADIPSRVPPDARLAPQWYPMQNAETGYYMSLLMSIWFGTQADEVYSNAWFSDASDVSASCVINTRPKLYLAPRLCYVRITIVSGHDLIPRDRKRTPKVYVKATLGEVSLKTLASTGSNPSWNQDLIFVASESLEGTVNISLIDHIDDHHEECIGKLKKKLSEMTAVKVPGAAPVSFYDIEPPGEVEPAGDKRRFSSRIKMRLATDQSYHVFDECIQYCSDYRAFAKGLWPGTVGKLEVGILGATGLTPMKNATRQRNAYVVGKYGNKWARTRTVVDNASPKWNEQYSWDIYEKCTVFTLGVYDNQQIFSNYQANDAPIGKVRIPLTKLKWNTIYTGSYPIIVLGKEGLKKMGEIQLSYRCACPPQKFSIYPSSYPFFSSSFRWLLPKSHYKSPLSLIQIENLRPLAVEVNCMNLARTEPPLRNEVVRDMLKPKSKSFSMRRAKANYERLYKLITSLPSRCGPCVWIHANIISTTDYPPKFGALAVGTLCIVFPGWIWSLAVWLVIPSCLAFKVWLEAKKLVSRGYNRMWNVIEKPPPLVLVDLKLSKLDPPITEELDEEFCSLPEVDVVILRKRYENMRKVGEEVILFMGDFASQIERLYALLNYCDDDPLAKIVLCFVSFLIMILIYIFPYQIWFIALLIFCLRFRHLYNDMPKGIMNFFRRLPTNEDLIL